MKRIISICLSALLAAALFASCADTTPPATSSPEITATPKVTDTPQLSPTPQATEAPVDYLDFLSIDFATEEYLGKYETYEQFTDPEAVEGSVERVALSTSTELKDFKFIRINTAAEKVDDWFVEGDVLHSLPALSPGKPLVIEMTFFGEMPTRGISFADESGAVRYYCIAMSGKDGSLILVEF